MKIKDIRTLSEVSIQYNISIKTLQSRLKNLDEDVDYRKLGKRQPTILSPTGIEKIIKNINGKN